MRRFTLALVALTALSGCHRINRLLGKDDAEKPSQGIVHAGPEGSLPAVETTPAGDHPRILLTPDRLTRMQAAAKANTVAWQQLLKNCTEASAKNIESGYEGEDWANAALDLALCGKILKDANFTAHAFKYMTALVDDRYIVGDKGGDAKDEHGAPQIISHDDGYPIRNRGFLTAIVYDWLHDDPRMTAGVKSHMVDRLHTFVTWYKARGYRLFDPIGNHYMAYFGAATMSGLATMGDDPKGTELRKIGRDLWNKEVAPAYHKLSGGDFPEGWQYARLVGAILGIYVESEGRTIPGGAAAVLKDLPWLKESVAFQNHALLPDGEHCFDNADWSHKPAKPYNQQLFAASLALGTNDAVGSQALFLARNDRRDDEPGWNWLEMIADDANAKGDDPRKGDTGYFAKGTGTAFARTNWTKTAIWSSINSAPFFGDHQHLDQGHFELIRGKDQLILDPGDYDAYSTESHNSILVDDKDHLRWSPNQGVYCVDCSVPRYEDDHGIAYAQAEFTGAYNPDEYGKYAKERALDMAQREWVFSRSPLKGATGESARLVIYDRLTAFKPSAGVAWTAHASTRPAVSPGHVKITVGASQALITTLLPANATATLLNEPTNKSDDIHMNNNPAEGITSTRIEVRSAKGAKDRRFLNAIAATAAGAKPPAPEKIAGENVDGVAWDGEAYVFTTGSPQTAPAITPVKISYRAPVSITRHMIADLAPGAAYAVAIAGDAKGCTTTVTNGGDKKASAAGVLKFETTGCAIKP